MPGLLNTQESMNQAALSALRRGLLNTGKDIGKGAAVGPFTAAPDLVGLLTQGNVRAPKFLREQAISGDPIRRAVGLDPSSVAGMAGEFIDPTNTAAKGVGLLAKTAKLAPEAIAGGKGLLAMTLFHGTPHKFSKFALDKIGTGEGAQAFGHGLYFAENPGVARSYKQSTVPPEVAPLQEKLNAITAEKNQITLRRQSASTLDDELADNARFDELRKLEGDVAAELRTVKTKAGHLYEVEIPDEITNKMLDWDKPLSEQPENVKKALEGLRGRSKVIDAALDNEVTTGGGFYKTLTADLRDPGAGTMTSPLLNEAGIPGIRFLDQQSRFRAGGSFDVSQVGDEWQAIIRPPQGASHGGVSATRRFKSKDAAEKWAAEKTGDGTRNIVVFNPDDITQVKRDGELVFENKSGLKPASADKVAGDLKGLL